MEAEGGRSNLLENRPHVAAWEREFTKKIGGFAWEKFVKAKKHVKSNSKIMEWNDSAGEKAFQEAKYRFWCEYNRLSSDDSLSDSYVYVDNSIDWYSKLHEDEEDENLMIVSKEEYSQNGGKDHGIVNFMLHPVVNVKHYAKKKLLPRATPLTDMSMSD